MSEQNFRTEASGPSKAPRALVFGISGQDGALLASVLLSCGYEVHGTSRDAQLASLENLRLLGVLDAVTVHSAAPTDFRSVLQVLVTVDPQEIYFLSGQSSVGLSFEQPIETIESIVVGTMNLLEAMRFLGSRARLYNAASSECFGQLGEAASESSPFRPRSPYALAKASAFWAVANYREAYGLHACSGILFNHESPLRPARFVTRKIVASACRIAREGKGVLTLGNLSVERDWGWAPEYVVAMHAMLQQEEPVDLVIATGRARPLEDFVRLAFEAVQLDWRAHVEVDEKLFRPSDLARSVGDPRRAEAVLGWRAGADLEQIVAWMVDAEFGRPWPGIGAL